MTEPPIHVLLIDNDISYAKTASAHLKKFQGNNFKITWEKTGIGGIERLKKDPAIDVVLVDYALSEMTALEVAREIRALKIDVPLVVIASGKDFQLAVEAMKLGVEDFLVKDEIVESVLPRAIVNVLNRVQLKRKIAQVEKDKILGQKRNEAIKELVVTICHEFNNPLAAIKISADIISRQKLNPSDRTLINALDANIRGIEKEIIKLRDINLPA
ncbi:MAG TPA: response regulator [Bacteroidota bacterium]|nr:response regulator [Bacteroidota bacterium]